jgi:nucleoside-diphosphate-sugar epimerase
VFPRPVNVRGTKNVLSACMRAGTVRRLVYTSTASVVIDGTDIQNGDESMPYPRYHLDTYSASKAHAERLVIAANGSLNGAISASYSLTRFNLHGPWIDLMYRALFP